MRNAGMKRELQALEYGRAISTVLPYEEAVERVKSLLKEEGFGILCEIDVSKTLQEKIGANFPPYRILGACNPQLAYRALSEEPELGLLLPCNVVVQQIEYGTLVSAIDAHKLLAVVNNPTLAPIADEVNARLARVLDGVAA